MKNSRTDYDGKKRILINLLMNKVDEMTNKRLLKKKHRIMHELHHTTSRDVPFIKRNKNLEQQIEHDINYLDYGYKIKRKEMIDLKRQLKQNEQYMKKKKKLKGLSDEKLLKLLQQMPKK